MKNPLPKREQQIMELIWFGHPLVTIADALWLSQKTVETYWLRVKAKLDALSHRREIHNKIRACRFMLAHGWLKP